MRIRCLNLRTYMKRSLQLTKGWKKKQQKERRKRIWDPHIGNQGLMTRCC
jgi:hypothetical protein